MRGRVGLLVLVVLSLLARPSPAQTLSYAVAKQDSVDAPAKAEAVLHVVVQGQPTHSSIEELLNRIYRDVADRPSKYHGRVTHVAVFTYTTETHARAGTAQWLGMISRIGARAVPKIGAGLNGRSTSSAPRSAPIQPKIARGIFNDRA